jgi:hypothetical protein
VAVLLAAAAPALSATLADCQRGMTELRTETERATITGVESRNDRKTLLDSVDSARRESRNGNPGTSLDRMRTFRERAASFAAGGKISRLEGSRLQNLSDNVKRCLQQVVPMDHYHSGGDLGAGESLGHDAHVSGALPPPPSSTPRAASSPNYDDDEFSDDDDDDDGGEEDPEASRNAGHVGAPPSSAHNGGELGTSPPSSPSRAEPSLRPPPSSSRSDKDDSSDDDSDSDGDSDD